MMEIAKIQFIDPKPTFSKHLRSQVEVKNGENINLECTIDMTRSRNLPTVTWYEN